LVQQSGLQRPVHRPPWGWRARAYRLILIIECLRLGQTGFDVLQDAREVARRVPSSRARAWRPALAELAGVGVGELPVELADFVWDAIASGQPAGLAARVERADRLIPAGS
jgi:hypothetical protein